MRPLTRTLLAAAAFALAGAFVPSAYADNNYDVSVAAGKVTVTAHEGWHINDKFPWKLTVGEVKLDKTKFQLSEHKAIVTGAPHGSGVVRGAICSAGSCMPFKADVAIP